MAPPDGYFMLRFLHIGLSYVMMGMAYVFSDGVETFAGNRSFSEFAKYATERHFGFAMFVVSVIGLSTVFVNNWKVRLASATVLSVAHAFVAFLFVVGNPYGTAVFPYSFCAFCGAALAYRTAYFGKRYSSRVESDDTPRPLAR